MKAKAEGKARNSMKKPIIVFSLVMALAPLPTIIPWLYSAWAGNKNTHFIAGHHGGFRRDGYPSMIEDTPRLINRAGANINKTVTAYIVRQEGWECSGLRDKRYF